MRVHPDCSGISAADRARSTKRGHDHSVAQSIAGERRGGRLRVLHGLLGGSGLSDELRPLAADRTAAIDALQQLKRRSYVSPWLVAVVYSELGDKNTAFVWLEKAYVGREHDLVFSNVWPMFDSLRSDGRFKDLTRRIGLPQS